MSDREAPRASTWLLERLAPQYRRESIVGDLLEQLHLGRSVWWYRRQVVGTIFVGLVADLAAHKLLAVRALAIVWFALYVVYRFGEPLIQDTRIALFSRWGSALWGESEVLRQLWVYYGLPFILVRCLAFMSIGWMVARLHCRLLPGIVVLVSATLLVPAVFQGLETRRLLETGLWPGWEWGSFRWAVVFHTLLSFVAYPLCIVLGGLWKLRTDVGHPLPVDSAPKSQ